MNKKSVNIEELKSTEVEILTPNAEKQVKGGFVVEDNLDGF